MPRERYASKYSPTTSVLTAAEETEWGVVFVGHRQKPSWCFAVSAENFAPSREEACAHCAQSSLSGAKADGSNG